MPEYTYEAISLGGDRSQGTLTAMSEREAMAMLDGRGLMPLTLTAQNERAATKFRLYRGVSSRTMATFYAQLADLLHSGVPLLRSLDILEAQRVTPTLSEVLRDVRARVADGTGLAQAMSKHPQVFSELAVAMIRAGQEGGFLEDVLRRIANFTEQQEDLKAKVVGSMAYPVILATVGFIIVIALMIFIVPQFEKVFADLDKKGQLPTLTKVLMSVSHFVIDYWFVLVAGMVTFVVIYLIESKRPATQLFMDHVKLKIPVAGKLFLSLALSRFTRILGTMLQNGIPILHALQVAKDSSGNKVIANAIEASAENVKGGDSLAEPLRASNQFPRDIVEMVAVAEESNNLEKVLIDVADSLDKRTSRQLELFVRLLEPVMLVIMAIITLFVVLGLLLPVFRMSSTVKG